MLAGIGYYAWSWPRTTETAALALLDERATHRV